ncbi:MAG: PHB depolymerase family esterase [Thermoleophilaceae bacterium]|nr:PHB depolymerase family esterase [Thermoleophilaceae bacterium]
MEALGWRRLLADNVALIERGLVAPGGLSTALRPIVHPAARRVQARPDRPRAGSACLTMPRARGVSAASGKPRQAVDTEGPGAARRRIDWRQLCAENAARIKRASVAPGDLSNALQAVMQPGAPAAHRPPAQADTGSETAASDERTSSGDVRRAPTQQSGVAHDELAAALRTPLRPAPSPVRRRPGRGRGAAVPGEDAAHHERTFTVGGRARRALIHLPRGVKPGAAVPLVCMLHGGTQDPPSFAAATRITAAADRYGFVAVCPRQSREDNLLGCWNWFLPEHQARGAGEPAHIAGIVSALIATTTKLTIDTRRILIAGFSAGGAMAAIVAATYPDLFAAVAVHSGLAYGCASDLGAAFRAMASGGNDPDAQGRAAHAAMGVFARPVPTIVIHGSNDRIVTPVNALQLLQQTMTANRLAAPEGCDLDIARPATTWRERVNGGHAYTRSQWTDRRGALMHELLIVDGLEHAWSGGAPGGSHTDPSGPDATDAIWRFFARATGPERAR